MSIFFDFEVGPSGRRFRKAVDGDVDDIKLFVDPSNTQLFGEVDIGRLIELSTLSICMINAKYEVIGFMALCDHPNVSGVDPAHWETWFRNLYQKFYLARNTLFIHFMSFVTEVEDFFIEEAFISVFQSDAYLLHIIMMVPPTCSEDCHLYRVFRKHVYFKYNVHSAQEIDYGYSFCVALRLEFCPKIKIRRAVEEDNDDITSILDTKCPRLKELYGDFYISEIIGQHPEMHRKILVADHNDKVVGVMSLNSDINYEALQNTYELEPHHGLMKTTALEKEKNKRGNELLRRFGEPIMLGTWSPFTVKHKYEAEPIDEEPSKENLVDVVTPLITHSKVNFDDYYLKEQSWDDNSEKLVINYNPLEQSKSGHSIVDLLDEDPFDYEIVNIDTNLFTVPEVTSYESLFPEKTSSPIRSRISEIKMNLKHKVSTLKKSPLSEPVHKKTYTGEPDAFMIELFGFREDINEGFSNLSNYVQIYF